MNKSGERFLFVLMGALGDVVRGMYVVNALKDARPDAHITWLVEPASAGILKLHPRIDEIIVFQRARGLRGVLELRKELAQRSFDVTLDLQRHSKSGLFSWFSGAPRRIGFHRRDSKEGNWLFNTDYVPPQGDSLPKVQHYLTFLEKLGIPAPAQLSGGLESVTLDTVTAPWVSDLRVPYLACILGSSWDSKDWPEEGYAGLLRLISGGTVVLLSDKSKIEMAQRLEGVQSRAKVINLAGKTSLQELVAVVQGARVCVGPDSGPGHIAGAVGTPHVTLFGPTPSLRNTPRGSEALAVFSQVGCAPCKRRVCPGLGKVCMKLIAPELVLSRAELFLAQ
jgi:ADP-heptose:LPS heptosyltransferase